MAAQLQSPFEEAHRSNWVKLRTLINLRWIAITGQMVAITVGQQAFDLELNIGLCYLAIGAAVITNLVALSIYPESKRLSEPQIVGLLVFDISQLSFLLFLTGGLNNPFALLILAQVTISATALHLRSAVLISAIAILAITLVARWNIPLHTISGEKLQMPVIFVFGFWVAILIGILFLGAYARRVTSEVNAMADALVATQLALSREQKLTDLGGVVAAAAHELGTPLATIKLVAGEMLDDLSDASQREDAQLISQQADRCRDILRSMGRVGKDDLHLRSAPLATVIEEAAEPHEQRGKAIIYNVAPTDTDLAGQPVILRRPEIIHGLRNLIQNAVDFARSTVWIDVTWSADEITVRITDDGAGYSASVLPRLGDPFLRNRRDIGRTPRRPEYEGMGLGLFIAKTLLERSGAELTFANGKTTTGSSARMGESRSGAIVEAIWNNESIIASRDGKRAALGRNLQIET